MSKFRALLANELVTGDSIYEEVVGHEAVAILENDWEHRKEDNGDWKSR